MTSICDSMSWLHPICMETQNKIPNLLQSAVWDDEGKAQTKAVWFTYSQLLQWMVYSLIWLLSKYSFERIKCITFIKTFWGFVHLVNSAVDYCQNWNEVSSWVTGRLISVSSGRNSCGSSTEAGSSIDNMKWSLCESNFIILNILCSKLIFIIDTCSPLCC